MKLEFHFDFGSPNAYLSHLVLPAIESRIGMTFDRVPVLLGGVFKATNNVSPGISLQGIKNKPEYTTLETDRFVKQHGIDSYNFNPFFPVNTLQIMRGATYAKQTDFFELYMSEIYRHMWSEPKKMDDPEVILEAFNASGLPGPEIFAAMQDPEIKLALIQNTERSVEMGTFGSPTFYVNKEIYFGKDRLRDVEEVILLLK